MSAQYKMRVVNGQLTKHTLGEIRVELEQLHAISRKLTVFTILVDLEDGKSTTVEIKATNGEALEFVSTASSVTVMDAVVQAVRKLEGQLRQQRSEIKSTQRGILGKSFG